MSEGLIARAEAQTRRYELLQNLYDYLGLLLANYGRPTQGDPELGICTDAVPLTSGWELAINEPLALDLNQRLPSDRSRTMTKHRELFLSLAASAEDESKYAHPTLTDNAVFWIYIDKEQAYAEYSDGQGIQEISTDDLAAIRHDLVVVVQPALAKSAENKTT